MAAPIVIDNGSGLIKAGSAAEDAPSTLFPPLVGKPKPSVSTSTLPSSEVKSQYIGREAQARREIFDVQQAIRHGVVEDWDAMERIWDHAFQQELRIDPSSQPVLLTEEPGNPKSNRERAVELMFDQFSVQGAFMSMAPMLALCVTGRTTGLVFDSGDGVSFATPIYEGFVVQSAVTRLDVAGHDITAYLQRSLSSLAPSVGYEVARNIKEKLCVVSRNPELENGGVRARRFELPDGAVISVDEARWRAPEALFNPAAVLGLEGSGIRGAHDVVARAIESCPVDARAALSRRIILAGGTTTCEGFERRFSDEVGKLLPEMPVDVFASSERKHTAWIGGSMVATLSSFPQMMISTEEYREEGPSVVHRKCL